MCHDIPGLQWGTEYFAVLVRLEDPKSIPHISDVKCIPPLPKTPLHVKINRARAGNESSDFSFAGSGLVSSGVSHALTNPAPLLPMRGASLVAYDHQAIDISDNSDADHEITHSSINRSDAGR